MIVISKTILSMTWTKFNTLHKTQIRSRINAICLSILILIDIIEYWAPTLNKINFHHEISFALTWTWVLHDMNTRILHKFRCYNYWFTEYKFMVCSLVIEIPFKKKFNYTLYFCYLCCDNWVIKFWEFFMFKITFAFNRKE